MAIKILADDVVSQIAAGEVVERPASVVKELLENSIDAGANRIIIRAEEAGRKLIEVSDDGSGILPSEVILSVTRHATSKLEKAEDLFHIHTLGFRGEALASIGSVSRMTVVTRKNDQKNGVKMIVEGGKILSKEPSGGTPGMVVKVENLFFNTPARLKFLKRDQTEKRQIDDLVVRYALGYPNKAIHLIEDGKPVLETTGNGNRREIISQLYGVNLAGQLLEIIHEDGNIKITGFVSPISVNRSNRRDITFFVNGRWVQDVALSTALMKAYQGYLMVGRYPLAILFLNLAPEIVDVNVHPAKAEVRFREPDQIFSAVQYAVRRALLAYSPVPTMTASWNIGITTSGQTSNGIVPTLEWKPVVATMVNPETVHKNEQSTKLFSGGIPLLRLIGQIGATYLVAEGPDGLYLIDQHAAHERVLYEKMTNTSESIPAQALLEAVVMQFPPASAKIIQENLPTLQKIGFHLEEFGSNAFRLSAMPALFIRNDPQAAIRSVVEDFEEDETPLHGMTERRLTARICKRMAVKGGTVLSPEEQSALLRDLEQCVSPRTCPHGRPTMIHLSVDLLERQFGRRGARSLPSTDKSES